MNVDCIARYTLFANNSEIEAKRRKNNVRRIVYKRCLLCFANRFFAICCMQDWCRGSGLIDEHKVFFRQKKRSSVARKLAGNNEQCTATHSFLFRQQYFIRWKNNFVSYSSCLWIVYSGLKNNLCYVDDIMLIVKRWWKTCYQNVEKQGLVSIQKRQKYWEMRKNGT